MSSLFSNSNYYVRQAGRRVPTLGLAQFFWTLSRREIPIERVGEFYPIALNKYCGRLHLTTPETAGLVRDVQRQADAYGIPLLLETHRDRHTQDLFCAHVALLLVRTVLLHGRIPNGQARRARAEDGFAFTSAIQSLWPRAMQLWVADAPGDAIFVFEPELGPPPHAYLDSNSADPLNRAAESLTLAGIAREAWTAAHASADSLLPELKKAGCPAPGTV